MSEFPTDWTRTTFGNVLRQRKEAGFTSEELLAVTSSAGIVKRNSLERRDTSNEDKSKYLLVEEGDIAYNTMRMWQGVSGVSRFRGIVSPAYTICTPTEGFDKDFAGYLLKDPEMISIFRQRSQGLVSDTWNLKYESFAQIPCTIPPLPEQKKIAEILSGIDREIAGVSQFMQRKRLLRESLLRQMIPHPSSFRHGPLPKGWTLTTIEEVCSLITYGFTNPMPTTDRGVYMVTAKDVRDGKIDKTTARFTSVEAYETLLTNKSRPKQNDILVTKDGTLGRTAVVGEETICINQSVALLRPSDQRNAQFLQLLLSSPQYQETMLEESGGSAVKHIYITTLAKMQMAIPNSTEAREEVVDCFDALNRSIHLLVRKHECLTNLKKALASDLLSGRKRVSV